MKKNDGAFVKPLVIIPCITGAISFCCSIMLVRSICKEKKKLKRGRERLLLLLSSFDMIFSIACGMSTFLGPSDLEPFTEYIVKGNVATCNLQGFLYQLGTCAPICNALISIYYLLRVKWNMTDSHFNKGVLPFMYLGLFLWAIGSSVAALVLELYNFGGIMGCWIDDDHKYPCEIGYDLESCGRASTLNADFMMWVFGIIPVLSSLLVSMGATALLYCLVRYQEKRARSYDPSAGAERRSSVSSTVFSTASVQYLPERNSISDRLPITHGQSGMAGKVFESGIWYALAFWLTYLPQFVMVILNMASLKFPHWIRLANVTLLPLQGFFNFLIYQVPQWRRKKKNERVQQRREHIRRESMRRESLTAENNIRRSIVLRNVSPFEANRLEMIQQMKDENLEIMSDASKEIDDSGMNQARAAAVQTKEIAFECRSKLGNCTLRQLGQLEINGVELHQLEATRIESIRQMEAANVESESETMSDASNERGELDINQTRATGQTKETALLEHDAI